MDRHAQYDHHSPGDPHEDLPEVAQVGAPEEVEGLEKFTLRSVGIDIGSSTSHLVFSRLTLRREGSAWSSRFRVTDRRVVYRSPIMLTPYLSGTLIDTDRVREFIRRAYREAGFSPDTVDTGAVVITGEALKKENARPIGEMFARESGKFICISAGPNHEALLAAHGCGGVALSQERNATVLNIDVGGGSTKLCLIREGTVASTAAISVGARLIAFDEFSVVVRLEEPARRLLRDLGLPIAEGGTINAQQKDALASRMAGLLFQVVRGEALSSLARELMVTAPLQGYKGPEEVDLVVCSGGVSEYIYGRDATPYGDLGPQLALHIRSQLEATFPPDALHTVAEGIRATVIGAGEYTVQASGSTSHLSGIGSLPAFGLKVVRPLLDGRDSIEQALRAALARFDLEGLTPGLALALSVAEPLDYRSLRRLAEAISSLAGGPGKRGVPLYIVLDTDVAKSLGGILKEELQLEQDVVVVDGIDVGDLAYLDIGRPMGVSEVVPVTVKSLVFPSPAGRA